MFTPKQECSCGRINTFPCDLIFVGIQNISEDSVSVSEEYKNGPRPLTQFDAWNIGWFICTRESVGSACIFIVGTDPWYPYIYWRELKSCKIWNTQCNNVNINPQQHNSLDITCILKFVWFSLTLGAI